MAEAHPSTRPAHSRAHHTISPKPDPLRETLQELFGGRDLFALVFARELRVRYKQTALGLVWVVLQALVPAVIFALVLGTYARLPSAGTPYLLFALSGFLQFGLFSGAATRAGASLVRDGQLVAKVYFPRAILPLASGSAAIVDFLVGLMVVLVVMAANGFVPTLAILALPLIVVLTLTLGLGMGMAISVLSSRYRDFAHAVPFVLQVLLYGSPVAYSIEILPNSLAQLYAINPLVPLLGALRWSLLGTAAPTAGEIVVGSISGAVIVGVGILVFSRGSRDLADVI